MAPKKQKITTPSSSQIPSDPELASDEQLRKWLFNNSRAFKNYNEFQSRQIFQETFYNPKDFETFHVEEIARNAGFLSLVDFNSNKVRIYPFLVYLFYANLGGNFYTPDDEENTLWSNVLGTNIVITTEQLGEILGCSYHGKDLDEIDAKNLTRDSISHEFLIENTDGLKARHLRPQARIINKMIIHSIMPRKGSYDELYKSNYQILRAIYGNEQINWAKFILNEIKYFDKKKSKFLFYGAYLTKIFQQVGIDLNAFNTALEVNYADQRSISLMRLPKKMEPYPSYQEYVARLVRDSNKIGQSSHVQEEQEQEHMGRGKGPIEEEDSDDIELVQPSRDVTASSAILKNQEILLKKQKSLKKELKNVQTTVKGMMGMVSKIWKKVKGNSRSPTPESW